MPSEEYRNHSKQTEEISLSDILIYLEYLLGMVCGVLRLKLGQYLGRQSPQERNARLHLDGELCAGNMNKTQVFGSYKTKLCVVYPHLNLKKILNINAFKKFNQTNLVKEFDCW